MTSNEEDDASGSLEALVNQIQEDLSQNLKPFLGSPLPFESYKAIFNEVKKYIDVSTHCIRIHEFLFLETEQGTITYNTETGALYLEDRLVEDEELYHCLLMFITNNHHENGTRISSI